MNNNWNNNCFYVYGLFYEDEEENNICFYIGKGKGDRKDQHLNENSLTNNKHKRKLIRNLREEGTEPFSKILAGGLKEKMAYNLEEALLTKSEVFPNVTNIMRGGEGGTTKKIEFTEERKRIIGEIKWLRDNTNLSYSQLENFYDLQGSAKKYIHGEYYANIESTKPEKNEELSQLLENPRGGNSQQKLTDDKIANIKWYIENTPISQKNLGKMFGVSENYVYGIKKENRFSEIKRERPDSPFNEKYYNYKK